MLYLSTEQLRPGNRQSLYVRSSRGGNARKDLEIGVSGSRPLDLAAIQKDAERVHRHDHVWDMYCNEFDELDEVVGS